MLFIADRNLRWLGCSFFTQNLFTLLWSLTSHHHLSPLIDYRVTCRFDERRLSFRHLVSVDLTTTGRHLEQCVGQPWQSGYPARWAFNRSLSQQKDQRLTSALLPLKRLFQGAAANTAVRESPQQLSPCTEAENSSPAHSALSLHLPLCVHVSRKPFIWVFVTQCFARLRFPDGESRINLFRRCLRWGFWLYSNHDVASHFERSCPFVLVFAVNKKSYRYFLNTALLWISVLKNLIWEPEYEMQVLLTPM